MTYINYELCLIVLLRIRANFVSYEVLYGFVVGPCAPLSV